MRRRHIALLLLTASVGFANTIPTPELAAIPNRPLSGLVAQKMMSFKAVTFVEVGKPDAKWYLTLNDRADDTQLNARIVAWALGRKPPAAKRPPSQPVVNVALDIAEDLKAGSKIIFPMRKQQRKNASVGTFQDDGIDMRPVSATYALEITKWDIDCAKAATGKASGKLSLVYDSPSEGGSIAGTFVDATVVCSRPEPQETVRLPQSSGTVPRLSTDKKRIVECAWHGSWLPPEGWNVVATDKKEIWTWSADESAVLIRASASPKLYWESRDLALSLLGLVMSFPGEVEKEVKDSQHSIHRYKAKTPTGEVQIEQHGFSKDSDLVWIAYARGKEALAALEKMRAARDSFAPLTSHACECGYDCPPPTTTGKKPKK